MVEQEWGKERQKEARLQAICPRGQSQVSQTAPAPSMPSKAHAPSATPGILEQKETGSSHRPSSSGLCGPSLKLSKTSLVVKMWEGQAQNLRARAGKVMTEEAGTFGDKVLGEKNGEMECRWQKNCHGRRESACLDPSPAFPAG